MQTSTFVFLVLAVLAVLPSAFTFMLAPTPLALRPATSKISCAAPSARARSFALRMGGEDEMSEDALEECVLVMKPCDPAVTTDEDQCLDEEALEACVEASEAQLQAKMAKLAETDKKGEMLNDGSF